MLCASSSLTYVCSNATGTTCTKRTITIPIFSTAPVCASTDLVVVTKPEWDAVVSVTSPTYDYVTGGAFWAFGFTGVMILYFSSHAIGLVIKAVRGR